MAIIELLAESADGLPLSAMSEDLRIPRSATHRLLTAAVNVFPGSFGTFAGLKTEGAAQVLDQDCKPIVGLYAVGATDHEGPRAVGASGKTPRAAGRCADARSVTVVSGQRVLIGEEHVTAKSPVVACRIDGHRINAAADGPVRG